MQDLASNQDLSIVPACGPTEHQGSEAAAGVPCIDGQTAADADIMRLAMESAPVCPSVRGQHAETRAAREKQRAQPAKSANARAARDKQREQPAKTDEKKPEQPANAKERKRAQPAKPTTGATRDDKRGQPATTRTMATTSGGNPLQMTAKNVFSREYHKVLRRSKNEGMPVSDAKKHAAIQARAAVARAREEGTL